MTVLHSTELDTVIEALTTTTTEVQVRPRYEGNNINTWIGFKHVNYMVEEAVLAHFREVGLSSRKLFEDYGLGVDIVELDTRILNAFHLDEEGTATVKPTGSSAYLHFAVTISKNGVVKDVTAKVKVALRRETYVDPTDAVPPELASYTVDRIATAEPLRGAELRPNADLGLTATHNTDPLLKELLGDSNGIAWRWRIGYPYCHNNDRLQMSGYLRLMEEAKDRLVAHRGISIKTLLDDRKWIPVVPRSTIRFLDEALMEEELIVVYVVEEIFKDITYTSRMDCYVVRHGELVPTATGTIVHGYADFQNRKDWALVSFDDRVLTALRGE